MIGILLIYDKLAKAVVVQSVYLNAIKTALLDFGVKFIEKGKKFMLE